MLPQIFSFVEVY